MIRTLVVAASALLALLVGVGVYAMLGAPEAPLTWLTRLSDSPVSSDGAPRRFVIRHGDTASEVASELERAGLIRSALVFLALVELQGVAQHLEVGSYGLSQNMTSSEIVAILSQGRARGNRRLTVPEGWSTAEIAARLEALGLIDKDIFVEAASRPQAFWVMQRLAPEADSLEGYLFPDTYEIGPNVGASALVERMVAQFHRKLPQGFEERASELELSVHQLVILASIVEREAALPDERSLIAGVFHNRLRLKMPLEADPTVQYALVNQDPAAAARFGFWKSELQPSDLEIDSPYNTYRVVGLPPGPISNPGQAALEAVVHPVSTDMLYFVARGDRSHAFSKSIEEHRANVERFR